MAIKNDFSKITLGELLSSLNDTIKRNAISILKKLQKEKNRCPICKGWLDIYGRCECCNKDAWN